MTAKLRNLSRKKQALLAIGLILGLLIATRYAIRHWPATEKNMQDIIALLGPMRTHCVGRYLIDLPEGFDLDEDSQGYLYIGLGFDHDDLKIRPGKRDLSSAQFKETVKQTILKWDVPKTTDLMPGEPATRLAKAIPFGDEVLLHTRHHDHFVKAVNLNYLAYREGTSVELVREANTSEADIAQGTFRLLDLAKRTSRIKDPLHAGPGACFDDILVAGKYDEEKFDLRYESPQHPDLHIRIFFAGIQEDEQEDIFARRRSAFNLWGVTLPTLLNRSYDFQGMRANEDGLSAPSEIDNGKTNYTFQFETRRSDGSIAKPLIRVVLNVGAYDEGKQIGTELTQGEIKALWEAIIKTLRPRPGAL